MAVFLIIQTVQPYVVNATVLVSYVILYITAECRALEESNVAGTVEVQYTEL